MRGLRRRRGARRRRLTEFVAALVWMAAIVSVGALSLLYILIRHGEVSRVAGVFYLVPVSAALCAYALFGQGIDTTAQVGIGVAALGVILAMRAAAPRPETQPS